MTSRKQPLIELIIQQGTWETRPPSGKGEFIAWCPWHDDRRPGGKPSLGVNNVKNNGRGVAKCMSGRCGKGGLKALAEAWNLLETRVDIPPWDKEIQIAYDYRNAKGDLVFQVVRYKAPGLQKDIGQRRPDPERNGRWLYNTRGITKILYRLPELRAADPEAWIFIVEGEKDADRLASLGLVATTNAEGAGKWLKGYTRELRDKNIAVLRDNDPPGYSHQALVCNSVSEVAAIVKAIDLGDLPEGGDVSDWLDQGHTADELMNLLAATPPYEPLPLEERIATDEQRPEWIISAKRKDAITVTLRLGQHGFFVNGGANAWYFDQDTKQLTGLTKDDETLKVLLTDRYQINEQDPLFAYLVAHLRVEAMTRGERTTVRTFSYYDREANFVLLDMGLGNVLKVGNDNIEIRENGADGILFAPLPDHDPWEYRPDAADNILFTQMVDPVNFSDEGTYTVDEQKVLFLLWVLSMAFESLMKTRPLALAVGPPESGKSSLFRYTGQMLIGSEFDVDSPMADMKGEEDFWANVSNSLFVCYDDVNANIRWMADALARVATGTRRSKRTLFTTNAVTRTPIRCMLALTAMTPSYALRSGFVASRSIIFTMQQLIEKREEYEIEGEIRRNRDHLMSDYAKMVQKALQIPMDAVVVSDPGLRLADFARVGTRIGMGLGLEDETNALFRKIRDSQAVFATQDDPIAVCLSIWITGEAPKGDDQQSEMLAAIPNNGRKVLTRNLLKELKNIAVSNGIEIYADTPDALGKKLGILHQAISRTYEIANRKAGRTPEGKGSWWQFTLLEEVISEDFDEDFQED